MDASHGWGGSDYLIMMREDLSVVVVLFISEHDAGELVSNAINACIIMWEDW